MRKAIRIMVPEEVVEPVDAIRFPIQSVLRNNTDRNSSKMECVSRIKYLIDIEGFRVGTRFMVKELGILDMDERLVWSRYFAVGRFSDLTTADRRQAIYVTNNVHGLRYEDRPGDESQEMVHDLVRRLAKRAANEGRLVAYKGGHYERDLLREVGYGDCAFNIEALGCPRFELLANEHEDWYIMGKQYQCKRHVTPKGVLPPRAAEFRAGVRKRILHCPRVELWCFMLWLDGLVNGTIYYDPLE